MPATLMAELNDSGAIVAATQTALGDSTITIDLREEGRAVPEIVGILISIAGTVDADFTAGATIATLGVLSDVLGVAMTDIAASGTWWIKTATIRYIRIAINETGGGTLAYYILY